MYYIYVNMYIYYTLHLIYFLFFIRVPKDLFCVYMECCDDLRMLYQYN